MIAVRRSRRVIRDPINAVLVRDPTVVTIRLEREDVDALEGLAEGDGVDFSTYARGVLARHVAAKRRSE